MHPSVAEAREVKNIRCHNPSYSAAISNHRFARRSVDLTSPPTRTPLLKLPPIQPLELKKEDKNSAEVRSVV